MFFDNRPAKNILQTSCFKPPLWFSTKHEVKHFRENFSYLSYFSEIEKFDELPPDKKIKIMREFNMHIRKKKLSEEMRETKEFENAEKMNKFVKNNYNFKNANKKLFECISYIHLSRDYFHGECEDQYYKSIRVVNEYYKKYTTPFKWMSSSTLYCTHYPLFYTTHSLREHAIFLCWRVVFICLNEVMSEINYCDDFSTLIQNCDKRYSFNSNRRRYKKVKNFLFYSIFLLNQVIPCQMRQLNGNLKNQSTSSGAIVIPELNPHVVSTFNKFALGLLQQSFFINSLSYFTYSMAKQEDQMEMLTKILNYKNQITRISLESVDMLHLKEIYTTAVDCVLNLFYDNEEMIFLMSSLFKIYHNTLEELNRNCWSYQLEYPFFDIVNENQKSIFSTIISHDYFDEYIQKFKHPKKKEKLMIQIYNRLNYATNMKNFLLGSCITIECLLSCFNISKHTYDDYEAFPKLVNLVKKVEILLMPFFNREEIANEIICWIISQTKLRMTFCPCIKEFFELPKSDLYFKIGQEATFIESFIVQKFKYSNEKNKKDGFIDGILSRIVNPFSPHQETEEDIKKVSKMKSVLTASSSNSNPEEKPKEKHIIIPFNEEDLFIWNILYGLYPSINDSKANIFPTIELNNFYYYPSKFFVPQSFYSDYNEQSQRWISRIVEYKKTLS